MLPQHAMIECSLKLTRWSSQPKVYCWERTKLGQSHITDNLSTCSCGGPWWSHWAPRARCRSSQSLNSVLGSSRPPMPLLPTRTGGGVGQHPGGASTPTEREHGATTGLTHHLWRGFGGRSWGGGLTDHSHIGCSIGFRKGFSAWQTWRPSTCIYPNS